MCSLRGTPQKTKLCILFYILYLLLISFLARGNLNYHSSFWCVVACMTTWQSSRWVVAAFVQQFIDTSRFFNIKKHRKTFSALPSPKLPKSELKSAKTKILFLSFFPSFFNFFLMLLIQIALSSMPPRGSLDLGSKLLACTDVVHDNPSCSCKALDYCPPSWSSNRPILVHRCCPSCWVSTAL